MSTRWSTTRKHGQPAESVTVSRLIVMGFVVAALLGAATGMVWVGWNLVKNWLAG